VLNLGSDTQLVIPSGFAISGALKLFDTRMAFQLIVLAKMSKGGELGFSLLLEGPAVNLFHPSTEKGGTKDGGGCSGMVCIYKSKQDAESNDGKGNGKGPVMTAALDFRKLPNPFQFTFGGYIKLGALAEVDVQAEITLFGIEFKATAAIFKGSIQAEIDVRLGIFNSPPTNHIKVDIGFGTLEGFFSKIKQTFEDTLNRLRKTAENKLLQMEKKFRTIADSYGEELSQARQDLDNCHSQEAPAHAALRKCRQDCFVEHPNTIGNFVYNTEYETCKTNKCADLKQFLDSKRQDCRRLHLESFNKAFKTIGAKVAQGGVKMAEGVLQVVLDLLKIVHDGLERAREVWNMIDEQVHRILPILRYIPTGLGFEVQVGDLASSKVNLHVNFAEVASVNLFNIDMGTIKEAKALADHVWEHLFRWACPEQEDRNIGYEEMVEQTLKDKIKEMETIDAEVKKEVGEVKQNLPECCKQQTEPGKAQCCKEKKSIPVGACERAGCKWNGKWGDRTCVPNSAKCPHLTTAMFDELDLQ